MADVSPNIAIITFNLSTLGIPNREIGKVYSIHYRLSIRNSFQI